jgi:hypothetical protein
MNSRHDLRAQFVKNAENTNIGPIEILRHYEVSAKIFSIKMFSFARSQLIRVH